jgi:ESX secretion system protein EccE
MTRPTLGSDAASYGERPPMVARPRTDLPVPEPDGSAPSAGASAAAAQVTHASNAGTDVRTLHRTAARSRPAATVGEVASQSASSSSAAADARGLVAAAGQLVQPAPLTPTDTRSGTVYGRSRPGADLPSDRSSRLGRLHIGWHSASLVSLSMIATPAPGPGMILGEDVDHRAIAARCFRPEPTLMTLIGGVWAAQIIAFRALAVGATIVVVTDDPASWHDFAARTGATRGQVIVTSEAPRSVGDDGPTLIVRDVVDSGSVATPDIGAWQTQMTVLRRLDERGVAAIHDGHLVLTQRLDLQEAMLAVTSLRLSSDSALLLQQLEPDMLAIIGSGSAQYLWWAATEREHRLIGPARR